jgi:8-oxo-dGTP diphosphatase
MMRFCSACGARVDAVPPFRCPNCDVEHWHNAKPCAGALVERDGSLLLVRRAQDPWRGFWDIPGGFCEPDELPAATAVREVREETGLEVAITDLVGMWLDRYQYGDESDTATTLNLYFAAKVLRGAVTPSPETDAVEWFTPQRLPTNIAFPDHAHDVLQTWLRSV